jgi:hypothetical protein
MVKYSFSVRLSCAYTNMSGGEGGLLIQLIKVFIWCNKCQSWPNTCFTDCTVVAATQDYL